MKESRHCALDLLQFGPTVQWEALRGRYGLSGCERTVVYPFTQNGGAW